jgi:WD40 repeat protein
VALSPDGKTVALGTVGTVLRLWDVATGEELFADRQGHDSGINALAFSPDGKTLASGGDFRQTFLWDWASKKRIGNLPVSATVLSFSSDGKQLATVAGNTSARDKVQIWDVETRKEALQLTVPEAKDVVAARFSSEGRKLFTLDHVRGVIHGRRSTVRLWDLAAGKEVQAWPIPDGELPRFLAADGRTMFHGSDSNRTSIYDSQTGRSKSLSSEASHGPYSISPDARMAQVEVDPILWTENGPSLATLSPASRPAKLS